MKEVEEAREEILFTPPPLPPYSLPFEILRIIKIYVFWGAIAFSQGYIVKNEENIKSNLDCAL